MVTPGAELTALREAEPRASAELSLIRRLVMLIQEGKTLRLTATPALRDRTADRMSSVQQRRVRAHLLPTPPHVSETGGDPGPFAVMLVDGQSSP